MSRRVNSHDPLAKTPAVGSRWVWEIDEPVARALIEVTKVVWNGEEWWIWTRNLLQAPLVIAFPSVFGSGEAGNDLSRFAEAVTQVGLEKHKWIERGVQPGVRREFAT